MFEKLPKKTLIFLIIICMRYLSHILGLITGPDQTSPTLTTTTRGFAWKVLDLHFPYNLTTILKFTAPLSIPWHPVMQKGQDFGTSFSYIGFFWNIADQTVSILEEKKMRVLAKVELFLLNPSARRQWWEVASVHGTLQHITFVYWMGRHHLAALSTFLSKFPNDQISHHMPRSTLTQLS